MLTVELFQVITCIPDVRSAQSRDSCPRQWRRSNVINEQSASTKPDLPISPETGHPRCLAGETSLASATLTNRPIGIRRNGPRVPKHILGTVRSCRPRRIIGYHIRITAGTLFHVFSLAFASARFAERSAGTGTFHDFRLKIPLPI